MNEDLKRLEHFPVMMFAIVMGFSGLTISFQKFHEVFGFSKSVGDILLAIDTLLMIAIATLYLVKLIKYPSAVKKEFAHPVRINFFAAISISLLLLSPVYHHESLVISQIFFYLGFSLQTFFTLYTISYWINNNLELDHSNPAWFIPIVGNIIVPLAGFGFIPTLYLMFYFSLGLFFWIVLFTVIFYRIIFHHQMAQKFMPTLFIFIAPPAVGFLAYIKLGYTMDFFGSMLFSLGLFFTILVLFMYKNFVKLKFFISWWAFTFPMAAMTISTIVAYHLTQDITLYYLAFILVAVTTFIVSFVAYRTIEHIFKKEICIEE